MLEVVLTSDYEIHGNGQGSPQELMVEPTRRMAAQLDRHGAKLTVMADTVEILRFGRHAEESGSDDFAHAGIEAQLRELVAGGHDVQLHLHPAYANATLAGDAWALDFAEYDLSGLSPERVAELVREGAIYLRQLLQPVDPGYDCLAFRAANWSMQPSAAIVPALLESGIRVDTSVFKWGSRDGMVRFDYAHAHDPLIPWRADADDVCLEDPAGELLEIPIYCEHRRLPAFASANRVYRAAQTRRHPLPPAAPGPAAPAAAGRGSRARRMLRLLGGRHAWKLDFNQCSGRQLIGGLERAARRAEALDRPVPLVLIGHSKLFTSINERQLEPFLAHVAAHPDRFRFATLQEAWASQQAAVAA